MKLDLTKPVYFYDDRNKDQTIGNLIRIFDIIDDDIHACFGKAKFDAEDELILFDVDTGEVLTINRMFWIATNEHE